jgi:hypothetical protein
LVELIVDFRRTLELAASQETCRQSDISSALHWNGMGMPLLLDFRRTLELAASQETCRQSDISSALHWSGMGMPLLSSSLGTSENSVFWSCIDQKIKRVASRLVVRQQSVAF